MLDFFVCGEFINVDCVCLWWKEWFLYGELVKLGFFKSLCYGYFFFGFEFGCCNVCVIFLSYLYVVELLVEGDGDFLGS